MSRYPNNLDTENPVYCNKSDGNLKPRKLELLGILCLDPQLVAEVSRALGGVTVVHKGSTDFISNGKFTEECSADGCPRRLENLNLLIFDCNFLSFRVMTLKLSKFIFYAFENYVKSLSFFSFCSLSRCGGQGDLLSGTLALFLYWATRNHIECPDPGPGVIAGWAASRLSRACAVQVIFIE